MEKNTILVALIALIIGAGGGYVISKVQAPEDTDADRHLMSDGSMMSGSMMQTEMDGMMQSITDKKEDTFDKAFLTEMIIHHQGAVQMAELALKSAKHEEIRDMARNIITAQNAEIKQMQDWEMKWYGASR